MIVATLFFSTYSLGQNYGCRLPNGSIHSPRTGTALIGATLIPLNLGLAVGLYSSPQVSIVPGSCPSFASSISITGNKCATTSLALGNIGLLATNEGQEVTFDYLLCPIDDYAWLLVVSSASMLFFKIRNRKD